MGSEGRWAGSCTRSGLRFWGASEWRRPAVSVRSRDRLETQVRVWLPPVASRGFICFPARPPPPLQRGGVTGTWRLVQNWGRANQLR